MTEKIVKSVTAHSVATSEVTKNAVNPRNSFIDHDKDALSDPAIEMDGERIKDESSYEFETSPSRDLGLAPDYPVRTEHFDARTQLMAAKQHLQDNRQKLQTMHQIDNIQQVDQLALHDTVLYREKKNISANIQSVRESLQRAAAKLPLTESSIKLASELDDSKEKALSAPTHEEINLDEAQLLLNGEVGAFDEDELRARVRKMQEKLTRVNQTLIDIENEKKPS